MLKKVFFLNELCTIQFHNYRNNNRIAIQLYCEDGSPMATATVNVPEVSLPTDKHVLIKDYAENRGMLKALVDACIVEDTGDVVPSGYEQANVCKLLVNVQGG